MTAIEIKAQVLQLLAGLDRQRADEIDTWDYKRQLKWYQNLLNDHLLMTRELADAVAALAARVDTLSQAVDAKEK